MKKVIVISTSLRAGSNSDMLADKFMEGALQAGHEVEKISLIGKDIRFCRGCLACQKLGKCVIQDDVDAIMQKVLHADVIVWVTCTPKVRQKTFGVLLCLKSTGNMAMQND